MAELKDGPGRGTPVRFEGLHDQEARVRRIPIVDRTNKVVGIVTQADIAVRLHKNKKTGAVVEAISRPFGM